MLRRVGRWIKRQFTHPYGVCIIKDCDKPRERWTDFCIQHLNERMAQAGREEAQRKFEHDITAAAEGMRLVLGKILVELTSESHGGSYGYSFEELCELSWKRIVSRSLMREIDEGKIQHIQNRYYVG